MGKADHMSHQSSNKGSLVGLLIVTGAIWWALWTWQPSPHADPVHIWIWYFGSLLAAIGSFKSMPLLFQSVGQIFKLLRVFGKDDTKGSAGFMSEQIARRKKLHRRKKGSRFVGFLHETPLWLWTETAHLILGPAGTQKTTAAILNFLMGCAESALITDIKGELWQTTRHFRRKIFKHRCVKVDPTDPENSIKINPVDPATEKVKANDPAALTYVRDMALQLLPDPKDGGGANAVFYKGARNLIVVVIFAVIVTLPPKHRNLAMVYRALSDLDILHDLMFKASESKVLNGEIADMANSTHQMAFGDGGNAKTFESFRINALQAMEAFGPGNYLAAITSETTFDFTELKEKPTSLYILIDFANSSVLAQFAGLLQWMASLAMVSSGNNKPVLFVLDEFCNAPLYSLPKILTLLRSAGVKVIMATQDLDDVTRVYGKHALETVLSETDIKQVLGGIRSKTTLEYFSAYLGEYTELSTSSSISQNGVQESISRTNRRLLTEDELRRLPDDAQIIIYGSERPILAKKVQVFAINPWRKLLGINTIYGNTRKYLPVEVRIGWWRTKVTPYGARLYRKMVKEVFRKDKSKGRIFEAIFSRLVPSTALLLSAILVGVVFVHGLPNLRWEYGYRGSARNQPVSYLWCSYVGLTSPGTIRGPHCPLILWRKGW